MLPLIHRLQSDEALMLAYQRGDAGAFECLYRRHKDGLFTFLYRACPRHAVVEEVAQDAWLAVIDAAAGYEARAKFRTWLYQIGHNRLADFWRRRDNHHEDLDALPEEPSCRDPLPGEELQSRLMTAVGELPGEQRDALLLREQGFGHGEIAAITGATEEAVKSRLRYARAKLRERLGDLP